MSSTMLRSKVESSSKLSVFQRLTLKKNDKVTPLTKSTINTKSKLPMHTIPQTSRSTIGPRVSQKKQQKQLQKMILQPNNYSCLTYPVEYAQNGFIIELETESSSNMCKINMNYNQYDILLNQIQHHFSMPIMSMLIKTVKVILPHQWSEKFNIVLTRGKGKIRQDKIETNSFLKQVHAKDMVEINPFKQIQESELRRKKMLLKEIPKLKIDKIFSKTEIDYIMETDEQMNKQHYFTNKQPKKNDYFYQQNPLGSPHRRMIKKDIFNLLTPRSKAVQSSLTEKLKQQKSNKKASIDIFEQSMPEISMFQQNKGRESLKQQYIQKQKLQRTRVGVRNTRVNQNLKILNQMTQSKMSLWNSPLRTEL